MEVILYDEVEIIVIFRDLIMRKSMKWKMLLEIMGIVVFIIAAFSIYVYQATYKSEKSNGEAIANSIVMGLEGAIQSREKQKKLWKRNDCRICNGFLHH